MLKKSKSKSILIHLFLLLTFFIQFQPKLGYAATLPKQEEWFQLMSEYYVDKSNIDMDGRWDAQCVDLADHYAQYIFGVPYGQTIGYGNANQLFNNASTTYFEKFVNNSSDINYIPQRGDIIFWSSGDYGHVGMVERATTAGVTLINQNMDSPYNGTGPVRRTYVPNYYMIGSYAQGWIRPRADKVIQPPQPPPPVTYTISWDTDGDGDVDDTTSVAYNVTPSHANGSKPADAGFTYTFTGWSPVLTPVTRAATYTATFTATSNKYTVTFDSNGGSTVTNQIVAYNEKAAEPAQPTKTGYTFAGWYTDEALTESFDFNTLITENITLYAKWTAEPVDTRISGTNRFDTAALISKHLYDSADTVILTTGRNFPDALSAGPLAAQLDAPILLSEVSQIPSETLVEIQRLGARKVIILGGQMAIDLSIEASLKNRGIIVERISGNTRFLTSIETAKKVRASSGQLKKAILVNGYGFADALSMGSNAAKAGIPILLTSIDLLSSETKKAIVEFGIEEIDVIGGELAVSKAVVDELAGMGISVTRISGASRFATSAAIAAKYFANSRNAIISTGRGFADALAAVPLAVEQDAPILLVEKDTLPIEINHYLGGSTVNNFTIIGGELAVSSAVRNEILNVLK